MVMYETISYPNSDFTPRRKGATAPESCSVDGTAAVQLKPTIIFQLNGPVKGATVNADTVILKAASGGYPIPGQIAYDDVNRAISFTPTGKLEAKKDYIIKLKKGILDLEDRELDVDLDGRIGGSGEYGIAFTTAGALGNLLQLVSWDWQKAGSTGGVGALAVGAAAPTLSGGSVQIDPGGSYELTLAVLNTGAADIISVTGNLSSNSTGVEITGASQFYGSVKASGEARPAGKYVFKVPAGYTGRTIEFELYVTGIMNGRDYYDRITFSLPVGAKIQCPPGASVTEVTDYGLYSVFTVNDTVEGNSNGVFDLGDRKADLVFYAGNMTAGDINAEFEIRVEESLFAVDGPREKYAAIPSFSYAEVPFTISPKTGAPTDLKLVVIMKVGGKTITRRYESRFGHVSWTTSKRFPPRPAVDQIPKVASIAFSPDDRMYVLHARDNKIVKYGPDGKMLFTINDYNGELLGYPQDAIFSAKYKKLLVADTYNARILVYDENGAPVSKLEWPQAARINRITRTHQEYAWGLVKTNYQWSYDDLDYNDEFLLMPVGIDTYDGENMYVSDMGSRKLYRYKLDSAGDLKAEPFTEEMDIKQLESKILAMNDFQDKDSGGKQTEAVAREVAGLYGASLLLPAQLSSLYNLGAWNLTNPVGWALIAVSWLIPSTVTDSVSFRINYTGVDNPAVNMPLDVLALNDGFCYTQVMDGKIKIYDLSPQYQGEMIDASSVAGGRIRIPLGMAKESLGNIWVADAGNQRIVQFDAGGNYLNAYRSEEYEIKPQKIKVRGGKLYIADANHDRPLVWDVSGELGGLNVSDTWLSPNGDGQKDNLTISYTLSQPAEIAVQAVKKSSDGGLTALSASGCTILSGASRSPGRNHETWENGRSDAAVMTMTGSAETILPDGEYQLKVSASFGDYVKSKSVDLTIDNTPPSVTLDRAPPAFSPLRKAPNNKLTIDYTVADNLSPTAEVKLTLYKDGKPVGSLLDENKTLARTGTSPVPTFKYEAHLPWNGRIGDHVNEGYYILELKATDLAGNVGVATQEVLVDITPPRIENVTFSNPYFSPNGDGRKDNTEITFRLSDNLADKLPVTVLVRDQNGALAAELAKRLELAPGEHTFTWEGTSIPGNLETLVPDGEYQVVIYAEDEAGNLGRSEPALVVVDTVPPSIEALAAEPNPFTPNNDGVKDTSTISFKLSEPCNSELRILLDDGTTPFRGRLFYDLSEASFIWDGRGERGEILGQAHPFFLEAEDRAGNVTTSEVQTIIVDHEPSLVPYVYADPDPFAPVNPANDRTTIKYYLARDGLTVNLEVLGRDARVVKTLLREELQDKGEQSVVWTGDHDPGYDGPKASADPNRVADGSWQFRITAAASDEPNPAVTTNTVVVDNVAPYLLVESLEIDQLNRSARLTYALPENASIEVAAYDSSDALIETVEALNYKTAGSHSVLWQPGAPPSGTAYIKVSAVDRALNSSELKTELFALAPQEELTISGLAASPNPFTPNGDGLTDLTRISYRLSGGAPEYRVNLDIRTESGSTVKTVLENEPQGSGHYSFIWDGKDEGRKTMDDGRYEYAIEVKDKLGSRVEARGSLLLVSTRPAVGLAVHPPVISPDGDGANDLLHIDYSIDYPIQYLSGDALVRLEVVNAAGEAVWSKIFSHTAGSYSYAWEGTTDDGRRTIEAGQYYVRAAAQDALGSTAVPQTAAFTVDHAAPEPSDFTLDPLYAKAGTRVLIGLEFEEELIGPPVVTVAGLGPAVLENAAGNSYLYSYTVRADDPEGPAEVEVEAKDLAQNSVIRTKAFVIDRTAPELSDLSVSPNPASVPAVSGQVSINFTVSEPLRQAPKVYVAQNGSSSRLAIVGGQWTAVGGQVEAKYDAIAGYDGPALITIEATDLAGNIFVDSLPNSLIADTTAPLFSNIRSGISSNPDFSNFAREGSEVTITFKSSEPLKYNPDVRVNGRSSSCSGGLPTADGGQEYAYKYTVANTDTENSALITITGFDPAGNEGAAETSSSAESFVIDLTRPLVGIAEPETDLIANPSPFMTNGQPGVDALQTTLYYTISEQGYVTVGVHKVPDAQTAYTRDDFTGANLVHSFDQGWQLAGQRQVVWNGVISQNAGLYDLNGNGWADPGKYAFIVEVRDRAGNVVEGKWGGTCWIQDNVLELVEPDRTVLGHDNPRPLYCSPDGDGVSDSTEIFFRVNLGITPPEALRPERISVLSTDWNTTVIKPVGNYTVRIYDASTNALIRTLVSGKELMSNKVLSEVWDGRDDGGSYVPEGTYNIEIDARDYQGGGAMNNLLTLTATVDVTAPTVVSHEPRTEEATPWINGSRTFNVDFFDQHNVFASKLKKAEYRIVRPQNGDTGWLTIFDALESGSYTAEWGEEIFALADPGVNTVYARAVDLAGNQAETLVFYLRKDAQKPSSTTPSTNTPTNNRRPQWSWTASTDDRSGIAGYFIKVGTTNGGSNIIPETWVDNHLFYAHPAPLAEGTYYAQVRAKDNAGNVGDYASGGNSVVIDLTPPVISGVSASHNPFSPGNIDGVKDTITFSYTIDEQATAKIYIDGNEKYSDPKAAGSHSWIWSPGSSISEGSHSYYIWAQDAAGNARTSETHSFVVDNTPPVISSVSHDANLVKGSTPAAIRYSIEDQLSSIASVTVRIRDAGGSAVAALSGGAGSASWDGKNSGGAYVVNGKYYYTVSAADAAGNSAATPQYGFIRVKSPAEILTGPGPGASQGSHLKVLKVSGGVVAEWIDRDAVYNAYYGLNVAAGDVDGDGKDEILTGPGPGASQSPHLKVLKVNNGVISEWKERHDIYPSGHGLNVAAGDVDGDGKEEIITGPGPGWNNGAHLKILKYNNNAISEWLDLDAVYGPSGWYGLNVAAGDVDGDGKDEIITGPGPGAANGSHLKIFKVNNGVITLWKEYSDVYPGRYYGLNVAAGDVDGDGRDEIITGPGHVASNEAHLKIFKFDNGAITLWKEYNDVYPGVNYGLNVAAGDVDGDGKDEILTGPGPKPDKSPHLKILKAGAGGVSIWREHDWVYSAYYGLKVGAGDVPGGVTSFAAIRPQSATLEAPVLIAPADEGDVSSLRPTFQWKHGGSEQWAEVSYQVDLARNDLFSIDKKTFVKSGNTGSPDKSDPNLFNYTYAIHEFDPGLDRDTYYWRVTALATAEAATSEVRSFTVAPELTLTGVTNYPNPFSPHRAPTKIRYRLGADADSVAIRIYDVAGYLVRELRGDTLGESSNIWQKYNDIEWDGRNGRGDLVVNGIYPFEVIARLGDRSVSGRGKIAVLK